MYPVIHIAVFFVVFLSMYRLAHYMLLKHKNIDIGKELKRDGDGGSVLQTAVALICMFFSVLLLNGIELLFS